MRLTLAIVVTALVLSTTSVEARGPRGMRQGYYPQYSNNNYYNTAPTYNTATPTYTVVPNTTTTVTTPTSPTTTQSEVIVQTNSIDKTSGVVQASGTDEKPTSDKPTSDKPVAAAKPATYVFANTISGAAANLASPGTAPAGTAQWKAEQSARMGSVAHIGGGFGGGSYEGNGYGFSPEHAIQNACFWGQRVPLEIGVARGFNGGYYATIFYY